MKEKPPLVTLQTIADEVGCTRATVSLALRNHPRISSATKEKIRRAADTLGYKPNADIAHLMHLLRENRGLNERPVMALISDGLEPLSIQKPVPPTWEGFSRRAIDLGYRPEEFHLSPKMPPARLVQILRARGIRAVVISTLRNPSALRDMDFSTFSVSLVGNVVREPNFSRCSSDKHANTVLAGRELWRRGARRIALIVPAEQEARADYTFLSGYYVFYHLHRHKHWTDPLIFEAPWEEPAILDWIKCNEPDGLIVAYPGLRRALSAGGGKKSQQPQVAFINVMDPGQNGINQRHDLIAAGSVDLVDAQRKRNETGLPERPKTLLIQGEWVEAD
jgi:LacI family transcriptional regulator